MSTSNNSHQQDSSLGKTNFNSQENIPDKKTAASSKQDNLTPATSATEPQNPDWFVLARKLRQENRQLVKNIVKLEQSLAETQEKLEAQISKATSADNPDTQQNQGLNLTETKISNLLPQLEDAEQVIKEKQSLIDDLCRQLETSQERVANLERECAFHQESRNSTKQKLLSLEHKLRELSARLIRQQHQDFQFKSVLDQCLESPNHLSSPEEQKQPLFSIKPIISSITPIPKIQSIKPWSSDLADGKNRGEPENYQAQNSLAEVISEENLASKRETDLDTDSQEIPEYIFNRGTWPSPLIRPLGNLKKLKSKSEIDLPKFPPLSHSLG